MATSDGVSSLSQLEQDVVAKTRATGGGASLPGAMAASYGTSSLSQLEQDVVAKTRATGGGASLPGAIAGVSSLSQLEQDVITKTRASGDRTGPGALGKGSSAQGELSQLEQDVLLKNRARGLPMNGAVASGLAAPMPYSQMEEDPGSTGFASMRELENQVIVKSHPPQSSSGVAIGAPSRLSGVAIGAPPHLSGVAIGAPLSSPGVAIGASYLSGSLTQEADIEGPIYAGVDYGSQDLAGAATGGIEAFVADTVVDAFGVEVVMSEEEEEKLERKRQRKLLYFGIGLALLVVVIALPVVFVSSGSSSPAEVPPTASPSDAPSTVPSAAPTVSLLLAFTECLASLSLTDEVFSDRFSPQFRAAEWLSSQDPYLRENPMECTDQKLIQRYVLAVFYFSAGGDDWLFCGQSDPVCIESLSEDGWLSSSNECSWFRVECNGNALVTTIDLGMLL
jgi:hypothetical protein